MTWEDNHDLEVVPTKERAQNYLRLLYAAPVMEVLDIHPQLWGLMRQKYAYKYVWSGRGLWDRLSVYEGFGLEMEA